MFFSCFPQQKYQQIVPRPTWGEFPRAFCHPPGQQWRDCLGNPMDPIEFPLSWRQPPTWNPKRLWSDSSPPQDRFHNAISGWNWGWTLNPYESAMLHGLQLLKPPRKFTFSWTFILGPWLTLSPISVTSSHSYRDQLHVRRWPRWSTAAAVRWWNWWRAASGSLKILEVDRLVKTVKKHQKATFEWIPLYIMRVTTWCQIIYTSIFTSKVAKPAACTPNWLPSHSKEFWSKNSKPKMSRTPTWESDLHPIYVHFNSENYDQPIQKRGQRRATSHRFSGRHYSMWPWYLVKFWYINSTTLQLFKTL